MNINDKLFLKKKKILRLLDFVYMWMYRFVVVVFKILKKIFFFLILDFGYY